MHTSLTRRWTTAAAAIGIGLVTGTAAVASATTSTTVIPGTGPKVFETSTNANITLSTSPQVVVTSPPLAVGNYLVSYRLGLVLGPNSNVVCAAAPTSAPGNTFAWSGAGNGATESGIGPNGVHGSANSTDVVHVGVANDTIHVGCNASNDTSGTYMDGGVIILERVGTWTLQNK